MLISKELEYDMADGRAKRILKATADYAEVEMDDGEIWRYYAENYIRTCGVIATILTDYQTGQRIEGL